MRLTKLFTEFFESERAGGFVLIACTLVSLLLANSPWHDAYVSLWHATIGEHTLEYLINDGLMTVFFLLVGLELERELYKGELSDLRQAALPIVGALGGMMVPAGIFFLLNRGMPTRAGVGIPMATDIAFAIGMLSLLGKRVPAALKVFLTALAVIDDLGAIVVIAIFYSSGVVWLNLALALGMLFVLFALNRLKVHSLWIYLAGGVVAWYFMLRSGIHPTITGVLLAFVIPFGEGDDTSASIRLQRVLHKPVSLFILPLFALANTAILLPPSWTDALSSRGGLGILAGLVVGKPLGILSFCGVATLLGISSLPRELSWRQLTGAAMLAGIGFTMSIFITLLAYSDASQVTGAKIAILVASLIAAGAGLLCLGSAEQKPPAE